MDEFNQKPIFTESKPSAVVLIQYNKYYYAITFGYSYYYISKYADKNWAFNFAQRVDYNSIKSLEVVIPHSQLNKKNSSYINDYNYIDINSGEALTKIDAKLNLSKYLEKIINDRINLGVSIKLNVNNNELKSIVKLIDYINYVISNEKVKTNIPHFNQVKDDKKIIYLNEYLEGILLTNEENNYYLDFDINYDVEHIELMYKEEKKIIDDLNIYELKKFINCCNIDDSILEELFIKINDDTFKLKETIYFDYFDKKVLLFGGNWFEFNQNYLNYLERSLEDIELNFDCVNPFYSDDFFNFIAEKESLECTKDEFYANDYNKIKKFFVEDNFNKFLETKGYENYDKDNEYYSGHSVEITDLVKDDTIYAVKIGNGSKLVYTIDQSLLGLRFIHNNESNKINRKKIKKVCLWFILERNNKLSSLKDLKSILLKNKLNNWKREVLSWGYTPIINISYRKDQR